MSARGHLAIVFSLAASLGSPSRALGDDALQWSGFALVRAASSAANPLASDNLSGQLQVGLDWSASPAFGAHLHLMGRTEPGPSQDGHAGTPEAYVEANLHPGSAHLRLRGGAFFLATSRENVDALWENPFTVSSSALNTWFGEELRPIGLDVSLRQSAVLLGMTLFRGNDTFGALPLDRGWALNDRWTLLGEKVKSGNDYSSVSADTDHRLRWSARAGWQAATFSALFTHIDNRSDGQPHGDLDNWLTRFNVAGADYGSGDWTIAGETGWGTTAVFFPGGSFRADLRASYLLVSRRLDRWRASVRLDAFKNPKGSDRAVTLAGFWTLAGKLRAGVELSAAAGERRVLSELRYYFARR